MSRMVLLLIIACFFVFKPITTCAQNKDREHVANPSLEIINDNSGYEIVVRRIVYDMNFDGRPDLLLCSAECDWSQNGMNWQLYLQDSSDLYCHIGESFSQGYDLRFELGGNGVKMWSHWHRSGQESDIYYSWITDTGIVFGAGMTLHTGDGGFELDNANYDLIFDRDEALFAVPQIETAVVQPGDTVRWSSDKK